MKELNPNNNSKIEKLLKIFQEQGIDLNSKINIYSKADKNILSAIKKEFSKSPGIYCWVNKINGESYIGSSKTNLYKRIAKYYYTSSFVSKSKIFSGLAKYGHQNFILIILEKMPISVLPEKVLSREKFWIYITKSEYNILKEPDLGSLGYKHTKESQSKMKAAADKRKLGSNFSVPGRVKTRPEKMKNLAGHKKQMIIVYVYSYPDLTLEKTYPGLRVAAREENFAASTVSEHIKSGKPLKKLDKLLVFSDKLLT